MASTDWRDALGALRGTMSDVPEETEAVQTPKTEKAVQKERLDIVFERKGRGGKTATIITGFTVSDKEVETIAAELKKRLGTGGSARGGEILIQGDRRQDILRLLTEKGFRARII